MSKLMNTPPWIKRNLDYDSSKRYPTGVSRQGYVMKVGELRQNTAGKASAELLEPLGYKVKTVKVNSHETDVTVKDRKGNIVLAISVKNEKSTSYFTPLTYYQMMMDLKGAKHQLIICSFGNILIDRDINEWDSISSFDDVIALGYQTLPEDYHNGFSANNDVYKRRVDNENTYEDLKKRLKWHLIKIGLLPKTDLADSTYCHVCSIYNNIDSNSSINVGGALFGSKNVLCGCSEKVSKDVFKGKTAESTSKTQESLDVKIESMDKKKDSMDDYVPLSQVYDLADVVSNKSECFKCGKIGNRNKFASLAYCDICIAEMTNQTSQLRELKRRDDYAR